MMRARHHASAWSRIRHVNQATIFWALELTLLALFALQCARLVWTAATPVAPAGDWRPSRSLKPVRQVSPQAFMAFDPFFRLSGNASPVQVTSLNIKLFGVREDRAAGRGSAIIALPDGRQASFAVGEEIMPGVTLASVDFDSVAIGRNGRRETLFLDQSTAPEKADVTAPPLPPATTLRADARNDPGPAAISRPRNPLVIRQPSPPPSSRKIP